MDEANLPIKREREDDDNEEMREDGDANDTVGGEKFKNMSEFVLYSELVYLL